MKISRRAMLGGVCASFGLMAIGCSPKEEKSVEYLSKGILGASDKMTQTSKDFCKLVKRKYNEIQVNESYERVVGLQFWTAGDADAEIIAVNVAMGYKTENYWDWHEHFQVDAEEFDIALLHKEFEYIKQYLGIAYNISASSFVVEGNFVLNFIQSTADCFQKVKHGAIA